MVDEEQKYPIYQIWTNKALVPKGKASDKVEFQDTRIEKISPKIRLLCQHTFWKN